MFSAFRIFDGPLYWVFVAGLREFRFAVSVVGAQSVVISVVVVDGSHEWDRSVGFDLFRLLLFVVSTPIFGATLSWWLCVCWRLS